MNEDQYMVRNWQVNCEYIAKDPLQYLDNPYKEWFDYGNHHRIELNSHSMAQVAIEDNVEHYRQLQMMVVRLNIDYHLGLY